MVQWIRRNFGLVLERERTRLKVQWMRRDSGLVLERENRSYERMRLRYNGYVRSLDLDSKVISLTNSIHVRKDTQMWKKCSRTLQDTTLMST